MNNNQKSSLLNELQVGSFSNSQNSNPYYEDNSLSHSFQPLNKSAVRYLKFALFQKQGNIPKMAERNNPAVSLQYHPSWDF